MNGQYSNYSTINVEYLHCSSDRQLNTAILGLDTQETASYRAVVVNVQPSIAIVMMWLCTWRSYMICIDDFVSFRSCDWPTWICTCKINEQKQKKEQQRHHETLHFINTLAGHAQESELQPATYSKYRGSPSWGRDTVWRELTLWLRAVMASTKSGEIRVHCSSGQTRWTTRSYIREYQTPFPKV